MQYFRYLYVIFFGMSMLPVFSEEETSENQAAEIELPHVLRFSRIMARLENQDRKFDPFAISMTAESANIQQAPIPVGLEPIDDPNTENLVQKALGKLSVTGVMPQSKSIILGGRLVSSGQVLSIRHDEILFNMRLDDVLGNTLVFTDLETGEQVNFSLNILPRGWSGLSKYGSKGFRFPSGAQPMTDRIIIE